MMYRSSKSKYLNKKVEVDGHIFDSKKESRRYGQLKALEKAGLITDLQLQVPYELIPAQKEPDTIGSRGGKKPGKTIERAVIYRADFQYRDKDGKLVVEDVKGYRMAGAYNLFVIKRKLMLWKYNIQVKEV